MSASAFCAKSPVAGGEPACSNADVEPSPRHGAPYFVSSHVTPRDGMSPTRTARKQSVICQRLPHTVLDWAFLPPECPWQRSLHLCARTASEVKRIQRTAAPTRAAPICPAACVRTLVYGWLCVTHQHNSTIRQQHNNTATQQHSNTATHQHINTATQQHSNTATQQHSNNTTQPDPRRASCEAQQKAVELGEHPR
jgi:hypothetical protein